MKFAAAAGRGNVEREREGKIEWDLANWEIVWIEGQVCMLFQSSSKHGLGIWEFTDCADISSFLKRKLMGFVVNK